MILTTLAQASPMCLDVNRDMIQTHRGTETHACVSRLPRAHLAVLYGLSSGALTGKQFWDLDRVQRRMLRSIVTWRGTSA